MEKLNYSEFFYYKDIEDHLLYLKDKYPDSLKLHTLEVTDEGRNVYLAEISRNVNLPETAEKGGYYVQASLHANECGGGSAAMHLIDTLLCKNPDILDTVVFYVVPRVNPDNVENNMLYNADARSRFGPEPRNKENVISGCDLNGDGLILQMRKKNPLGDFKEVYPGVMVPRAPGENEGEFYDVYPEGIIENYNGTAFIKSSKRSYDYNRSFPTTWTPRIDSTEYPLRDKEIRAVAEFIVTHPNIFAGLDFHNGYSGILRPAMKPDDQMNKQDLELILKVGEIAAETTGLPLIHEYIYGSGCVPYVRHGDMNEFFHYNLGASHYVVELGNGVNDAGYRSDDFFRSGKSFDDVKKEVFSYAEESGNHTAYPFEPFKHPQLGEVEIGGIKRGTSYYMNPKNMAPLVEKTTAFVLKHAAMGPVIKADNIEVKELGEGLLRIRTQIKNTGFFGTKVIKETDSYQAKYPVHAYLEASGDMKILSRPNVYEVPQLDSMESYYLEWFVKCSEPSEITLTVAHPKAKSIHIKIK